MMNDVFEQAFSDFLEQREYDDGQDAFFSVVRAAFRAGWLAAGGEPPLPRREFAKKSEGGSEDD